MPYERDKAGRENALGGLARRRQRNVQRISFEPFLTIKGMRGLFSRKHVKSKERETIWRMDALGKFCLKINMYSHRSPQRREGKGVRILANFAKRSIFFPKIV